VLGIIDFLIFLFSRGMSSPKAAAALGIAGALIGRSKVRLNNERRGDLHRAL
jgi:hypothetical protein